MKQCRNQHRRWSLKKNTAFVKAKLKLTDVNAAISLCSESHKVYADFAIAFFENWQKILSIKPGEKVQNPFSVRKSIDANKNVKYMGKEVENLISENTELLATKYVYFDSNRSSSNPYKTFVRIRSVFHFNFSFFLV